MFQQRRQFQFHRAKTFDPTPYIMRSKIEVTQTVEEEFIAKNSFNNFNVVQQIKNNILSKGYTTLTPIQDEVIPLILEGKDVVGIAKTGTGKTAAFLIPLINKCFLNRNQRVLIITPTRELAVQIRDELVSFSAGLNIDSVLCIGGVSIFPQTQRLRRNPQFVIGTPGRLGDLQQTHKLNLFNFNNIVLDEVDRMLDIGFVREIKYLVSLMPKTRQSLFFSATMPLTVVEIMRSFANNPVMVSVKSTDTISKICQEVVRIGSRQKIDVLHDLLVQEQFKKVLVFGRTKYGMEKLAGDLFKRGFRVAAIHGNKNQNQRQKALNDFKCNQVQVLLATDIA